MMRPLIPAPGASRSLALCTMSGLWLARSSKCVCLLESGGSRRAVPGAAGSFGAQLEPPVDLDKA